MVPGPLCHHPVSDDPGTHPLLVPSQSIPSHLIPKAVSFSSPALVLPCLAAQTPNALVTAFSPLILSQTLLTALAGFWTRARLAAESVEMGSHRSGAGVSYAPQPPKLKPWLPSPRHWPCPCRSSVCVNFHVSTLGKAVGSVSSIRGHQTRATAAKPVPPLHTPRLGRLVPCRRGQVSRCYLQPGSVPASLLRMRARLRRNVKGSSAFNSDIPHLPTARTCIVQSHEH